MLIQMEKVLYCVQSRPQRRTHQDNGRSQLLSQFEKVHGAASLVEGIGHIQKDKSGQAQSDYGGSERELTGEVGYVEDEQDSLGPRHAPHSTSKHIERDSFIFGIGSQAVHAGQINEPDFSARAFEETRAMLHRCARVIANFLTKPGQAIKERRLS